jgi:hypothetical protein
MIFFLLMRQATKLIAKILTHNPISQYDENSLGAVTGATFVLTGVAGDDGFIFSPTVARVETFPSCDSLRTRMPSGLKSEVCDSSKM